MRRHWKKVVVLVLVLGIGIWSFFYFRANSDIKPGVPVLDKSVETTVLLGPADDNGDIDYVAALNQKHSQGVTPKSNAVVALINAIGPELRGVPLSSRFYRELGIKRLDDNKQYYQSFDNWLKKSSLISNANPVGDPNWTRYDYCLDHYWNAKDFPKINQWVDENTNSLNWIEQSTRRPNYFVPLEHSTKRVGASLIHAEPPYIDAMRPVARLLAIRAKRELPAGNYGNWKKDVLTIYRLANALGKGPTLREFMIAIGVTDLADFEIVNATQSGKLTPDQLKDIRTEIERLQPIPFPRQGIVCKQYSGLELLQIIGRTGSLKHALESNGIDSSDCPAKLPADLNEAAKVWNHWWGKMRKTLNFKNMEDRYEAIEAFDDEFEKNLGGETESPRGISSWLVSRKTHGKNLGRFLVSRSIPSLAMWQNTWNRVHTARKMASLAISLEIYRQKTGKYPSNLNQLVPDIIPALPVDYYRNKPFGYHLQKTGYLLYSYGADGIDHGGEKFRRGIGSDLLMENYQPKTFEQFQKENK